MIEELQDGDAGWCRADGVKVLDAEHHGNAEQPSSHKSHDDCAYDGDGNGLLWVMNLLSHVRGRIEAVECPVAVDEADDVGNSVVLPASVVDESGKDKLGRLMRFGLAWYSQDDDEERNDGGPKREECNGRERSARDVEDGAKYVDNLIGNEAHPWLDDSILCVSLR